MKTSDKELDDLFQSKLNNLELEPDAKVWTHIVTELDGKPKKKSIVPTLRIAASLIIVLSIGLFLMRKTDELVKKPRPPKLVKVEVKQQPSPIHPNQNLDEKKNMLLLSAKNKVLKEAHPIKRNIKPEIVKQLIHQTQDEDGSSTQTLAQNKTQQNQQERLNEMQIASATIATVPVATTKLSLQPEAETPEATNVKPQILPVKRSTIATVAKRKSIRNVGDLVNLVMAKVDKRPNKLIEFGSDDDEEPIVTGINLGIISIKKEK